ncbi:hypothetical protein BD770DRAFT_412025 [Pilaira anomala]|nr:hypothetical protein BD770DRAFT_412025 [Pilaira anomala]
MSISLGFEKKIILHARIEGLKTSIKVTTSPGGGVVRFRKYVDVVFYTFNLETKYCLVSANLGARIVHAATVPLKLLIINTTSFKENPSLKIRAEGCGSNEDDPYLDGCTRWFSLDCHSSDLVGRMNCFFAASAHL